MRHTFRALPLFVLPCTPRCTVISRRSIEMSANSRCNNSSRRRPVPSASVAISRIPLGHWSSSFVTSSFVWIQV